MTLTTFTIRPATIRPARPGDAAEITAMIRELAEFERAAPDEYTVTADQIHAALFGPAPTAHAHIAEADGRIAGMAVWFVNFSTWHGEAGMYLEDLFVRPAYRRGGLARALLAELARVCVAQGYTRLTWSVLDWNVDAIAFYRSIGARPLDEWTNYRLAGPALSELADSSGSSR